MNKLLRKSLIFAMLFSVFLVMAAPVSAGNGDALIDDAPPLAGDYAVTSEINKMTEGLDANANEMYCLAISSGIVAHPDNLDWIKLEYTSRYGEGSGVTVLHPNQDDALTGEAALHTGSFRTSYAMIFKTLQQNNPQMYFDYTSVSSISGLEYKINPITSDVGISPMSTSYIFFKPNTYIETLNSIALRFKDGQSGNWSVNRIDLFKITSPVDDGVLPFNFESYSMVSSEMILDANASSLIARVSPVNDEVDLVYYGEDCVTIRATRPEDFLNNTPLDVQYYINNNAAELAEISRGRQTDVKHYVMNIDIADEYKAGLEFNSAPAFGELKITDCISAEIEYKLANSDGKTDIQTVPVITNSVLYWMYRYAEETGVSVQSVLNDFTDGKFIDFCRQGDVLAVPLNLPGCEEIKRVTLLYEGVDIRSAGSGEGDEAYGENSDYLEVASIVIYDAEAYTNSVGVIKDSPEIAFEPGARAMMPAPEFTPADTKKLSGGVVIGPRGEATIEFQVGGSAPSTGKKLNDTYLITLTTDSIALAGTQAQDLGIKLRYYDRNNVEQETALLYLHEMTDEFYGYWVGQDADGKEVPAAYAMSLAPGGSFSFLITLKNVSFFSGISLSLGKEETDEWQLGSFSITYLGGSDGFYGRRVMKAAGAYDVKSAKTVYPSGNGVTVDRVYSRLVKGDLKYDSKSTKPDGIGLLVQRGSTVDYEFYSEKTEVTQEVRNYEEYKYEMSYEEASKDLHFNDNAANYQLLIKVANNAAYATRTDDCGSNNLYYFQLIFNKGNSGIVLANDQLKADGFIAGASETINFSTNEDFGDLISVNIIPDDVDENSDPLDKLCIETMTLTKIVANDADRVFKFNNVGWVTRDYRSSEATASVTKKSRSASDLVCSYTYDTVAYALNLEFQFIYDDYKRGTATESGQYEGELTMDLAYYTEAGTLKQIRDFDVIKAMYNYQNRSSRTDGYGKVTSDPDTMFRANTTDRFIVTVDDAASLAFIRLHGTAKARTYLNLHGVVVNAVPDSGRLRLNSNGEYQYDYEENPEMNIKVLEIVQDITNYQLPAEFMFTGTDTASNKQYTDEYTLKFADNTLPQPSESAKERPYVPRVPESSNDVFNAYVVMYDEHEDGPSEYPGFDGFNMEIALTYQTATGLFVTKADLETEEGPGGERYIFYHGLSAFRITALRDVRLQIDGGKTVRPSYVVLQQIRNNVVIATYRAGFSDINLVNLENSSSCTSLSTDGGDELTHELTISLGAQTEEKSLSPDSIDLAVAVDYTCQGDPYSNSYATPYTFLTDLDYNRIAPGSMVKFNIPLKYPDEVTGIELTTTGSLSGKVQIAGAYMKVIDQTGKLLNVLSFSDVPDDGIVTTEKMYVPVETGSTLVPTTVEITTAPSNGQYVSGTDGKVRFTLCYEDIYQNVQYIKNNNFKGLLSSGNFENGQTAVANLLLGDVEQIRYIELEPYYDTGTKARWTVDDLKITIEKPGETDEEGNPIDGTVTKELKFSEPVTIEEGTPKKFNFSVVAVRVDSYYKDLSGMIKGFSDETTTTFTREITVPEGTEIKLDARVNGSLPGEHFTMEHYLVDGASKQVIKEETSPTVSKAYTVVVTGKYESGGKTYTFGTERFVFTSTENKNVVLTFDVHVKAPDEPVKPAEPEEPEPKDPDTPKEPEEPAVTTDSAVKVNTGL